MKNLLFLTLVFFSFSCEDKSGADLLSDSQPSYVKAGTNEDGFSFSKDKNYKISCDGPCDCGLQGILGEHVQCKCSDCVMIIEETSSKGNIITLKDAELKIPHLEDFHDYVTEKFGDPNDVTINLIEVNSLNDIEAYRYEFSTKEGVDDDVIIVVERSDKTYSISCDGTCDCKSMFIMDPPSASCSCSDCIMTVEEKE